jgi:hypothetical protein
MVPPAKLGLVLPGARVRFSNGRSPATMTGALFCHPTDFGSNLADPQTHHLVAANPAMPQSRPKSERKRRRVDNLVEEQAG